MDTQGEYVLSSIQAQRETAELVSQEHLRWSPSVGQDWGAMGRYKEDGPAQNQVLSVPLNFTPSVAMQHRTHLLERVNSTGRIPPGCP